MISYSLPENARLETMILRRPVSPRRQLAPGDSKSRYLRNYCINVGRASEIWHGLSFAPFPFLPSGSSSLIRRR